MWLLNSGAQFQILRNPRRLVPLAPPNQCPRIHFASSPWRNPTSRSPLRCSSGDSGNSAANDHAAAQEPYTHVPPSSHKGFWSKWMEESAEMRSRVAKLGLAAVLAYGLFDGVTYTTFFVLAFLGYEKSTGMNPAANLKALLGIVVLMWTGNNITRPFRVAGAAALAPAIDKGLKKIQKYFNFGSPIFAFALVVCAVAASCLLVVGLLILSRWRK